MNPDYSYYLRPIFTEQVVEKLLNDTSLNPFGEKGIGKKRLLDDLMALATQQKIAVIRLNMKAYSNSYASFLRQTELDLNKLVPADSSRAALMDGKMDLPIQDLPCLNELLEHRGGYQ